jgi:hypothetical protein
MGNLHFVEDAAHNPAGAREFSGQIREKYALE